MARLNRFPGNCGMRILYRLNHDPAANVATVQRVLERSRMNPWNDNGLFGIVVFTDRLGGGSSGGALASFIRKNKLGKVSMPVTVRNPNTTVMIGSWSWLIDRDAVVRWGG